MATQNLCLKANFYRLWAASAIHSSVTTSSYRKYSRYRPWKPTPGLLKSKFQFCDGEACSFQRPHSPRASKLTVLGNLRLCTCLGMQHLAMSSWISPETELQNTCFARSPVIQRGNLQDPCVIR